MISVSAHDTQPVVAPVRLDRSDAVSPYVESFVVADPEAGADNDADAAISSWITIKFTDGYRSMRHHATTVKLEEIGHLTLSLPDQIRSVSRLKTRYHLL